MAFFKRLVKKFKGDDSSNERVRTVKRPLTSLSHLDKPFQPSYSNNYIRYTGNANEEDFLDNVQSCCTSNDDVQYVWSSDDVRNPMGSLSTKKERFASDLPKQNDTEIDKTRIVRVDKRHPDGYDKTTRNAEPDFEDTPLSCSLFHNEDYGKEDVSLENTSSLENISVSSSRMTSFHQSEISKRNTEKSFDDVETASESVLNNNLINDHKVQDYADSVFVSKPEQDSSEICDMVSTISIHTEDTSLKSSLWQSKNFNSDVGPLLSTKELYRHDINYDRKETSCRFLDNAKVISPSPDLKDKKFFSCDLETSEESFIRESPITADKCSKSKEIFSKNFMDGSFLQESPNKSQQRLHISSKGISSLPKPNYIDIKTNDFDVLGSVECDVARKSYRKAQAENEEPIKTVTDNRRQTNFEFESSGLIISGCNNNVCGILNAPVDMADEHVNCGLEMINDLQNSEVFDNSTSEGFGLNEAGHEKHALFEGEGGKFRTNLDIDTIEYEGDDKLTESLNKMVNEHCKCKLDPYNNNEERSEHDFGCNLENQQELTTKQTAVNSKQSLQTIDRKQSPMKAVTQKEVENEKFKAKSDKTNISQRPQMLLLEIVKAANITNYEHFLHERIGTNINFKIDKVNVKSDLVEVFALFPSKTASRKAALILHKSNKDKKTKVWCYYEKLRKTNGKTQSNVRNDKDVGDKVDMKPIEVENIKTEHLVSIENRMSHNGQTQKTKQPEEIHDEPRNHESDRIDKLHNSNIERYIDNKCKQKEEEINKDELKRVDIIPSVKAKVEKHKNKTEIVSNRKHANVGKSQDLQKVGPGNGNNGTTSQTGIRLQSKSEVSVLKKNRKTGNIEIDQLTKTKLSNNEKQKETKDKENTKDLETNFVNGSFKETSSNGQEHIMNTGSDKYKMKDRKTTSTIQSSTQAGFKPEVFEQGNETNDVSAPKFVKTINMKNNNESTTNKPKGQRQMNNSFKERQISGGNETKKTNGTRAKCQPQVVVIEIRNLPKRFTNMEQFLSMRLANGVTFKIQQSETVKNVTFLSVQFPSTNSSRRAMTQLQNSNSKFETKVNCYIKREIQQETQQNLRNRRLSQFVSNLADDAKKLFDSHDVHISELKRQIDLLTGKRKKKKFQTLELFERKKKEKEALMAKLEEIENQKTEFRTYIQTLHCKLETMKDSNFSETDLSNLKTDFKTECERFSNGLPIYALRSDIVKVIVDNQTSVILGETGSGKSTQVVQYLYQTGLFSKNIVCTQPRKVAAISLATRVADEMATKIGQIVGYQVGLNSKKSKETKILYMTDHVLLNECLKDPLLTSFSCVIIDEAHERSIFTDLLLGMIKKCLKSRPDLRVVITSATIDPDVFVRYFGDSPVLSVPGRLFPVEVVWADEDCGENYEELTLQKAIEVHLSEDKGDILVFLTSPMEVEKCCQSFENKLRRSNNFVCLPLHGKLQANEQQRVFNPAPRGKRKIVFATNSAETSITIPGIKYVVDSGRIKEMKFDPKRNISSLVVTLVTKSSANQRQGRAGRTSPGKCYRLYSKTEYGAMEKCSTPEILRVNLGQALIKLLELGVDPVSFDYVESPPREQLTEAMETLKSIGAVANDMLTDLGKWIAKLPFDPIFGVFVHDALESCIGIEALIVTACCGSGGSLFYRSGSNEEKSNADKTRIRFSHHGGDLMTMLNAYRQWQQQPEKSKSKWCVENYVNGKTIKAVRETVTEVLSVLRKELNIKIEFKLNEPSKVDVVLQKMIFKTFKHNICHFLGHERAGYHVIHKEHNVCLFPSSSIPSLGIQPEWIVIEQVLKINRDYGVNATPVPIEWIKEGLEEGWLKPFIMDQTENQKVKKVLHYGVGDQSFRDFVGQRYSRLKELELTFNVKGCIVIVDTDSKAGEIDIYSTNNMASVVTKHVEDLLIPIKERYKSERSEQYLSLLNQGTRVVITAGCNVADVLMPDEYKSVIVTTDPISTSYLTVDEVMEEFEKYGEIDYIEKFHFTNNKRNWGKVTFKTMEEAEFAVEESREEEIVARPTGSIRLQNQHRFRAKIEWCRRKSQGHAFIDFSDDRIAKNILKDYRTIIIGGTKADLSLSRNSDSQLFVFGLNRFVNEAVLRHSFVSKFHLHDDHIVRAFVVRERVHTSRTELEAIRHRLFTQLGRFVKEGRYDLFLKPPKDPDFTFLAFASFSKIDEGQNACRSLEEDFRPKGEIVNTSVTIQASVLVVRVVFEQCGSFILETISNLNKEEGVEIRHKILRNGNCSVDMNCDHIDTLHRVRRKIDKIIQGKKMTKQQFPNIQELFTRAGKYEIRNTMAQTNTLIIDDYRILEISIYGEHRDQTKAFEVLENYLFKLTQGINRTLTLRGPDKPFGVIREMFLRFGIDLGKLKTKVNDLHCVQVDLRHHSVSINGTEDAVEKAVLEITAVIDHLRSVQDRQQIENEEHQCSICFTEIEEGKMYRLESCAHPFCRNCLVPQLESAVNSNDFPISCCKEGCVEMWSWRDLTKLALQSGMSINNLVNRATSAFIAKNDKKYRYCISPDCPSIYRVTETSNEYSCFECGVRLCTACHTQFHDGFSCDMMKELKDDSTGIKIWLSKDPHNRKLCPNCGLPIEKAGGCNHMKCSKCRCHICWVCLAHFDSSSECYGHLGKEHGGFGGGY